jgi:hypothetical protein
MGLLTPIVVPQGFVSFSRYCTDPASIDWLKSRAKIVDVEVHEKTPIEELEDCSHVDFANMYLGGGVMRRVCRVGRGREKREARMESEKG